MLIKGSIQQDTTIINIYTPSNRTIKKTYGAKYWGIHYLYIYRLQQPHLNDEQKSHTEVRKKDLINQLDQLWAFLIAQLVNNLPTMQEAQV